VSLPQQASLIAWGWALATVAILGFLAGFGVSLPMLLAVATAIVVWQIVYLGFSIVAAILLAIEELAA
jgi:hypothetical protein